MPKNEILALFPAFLPMPDHADGDPSQAFPGMRWVGAQSQSADAIADMIEQPASGSWPVGGSTNGSRHLVEVGPADEIAAYAELKQDCPERFQQLPAADKAHARLLSLGVFYSVFMDRWRIAEVEAGRCSSATREKELQALKRYDDWDRDPGNAPSSWPAGKPWQGQAIGYLTGARIESCLKALCGRLAAGTVVSTWNHLRTVLNFAVRIGALDRAPKPAKVNFDKGDGRLFVETFSLDDISEIYRQLAGQVQLQAAFVVALNTGLRAVDLLTLRWRNVAAVEQPQIRFRSVKTRKQQAIPLADCTLRHLRRLQPAGGEQDALVFDQLANVEHRSPTRSKPARRAMQTLKRAIAAAGLSAPDKPWQTCRATCNTRLENHWPGVGRFVLGHSLSDVNCTSYHNPSEMIYEAIQTLPQPEAFERPASDDRQLRIGFDAAPTDDELQSLVEWIRARGGRTTATYLTSRTQRYRDDREAAERHLEKLVETGWLTVQPNTGRQRAKRYVLTVPTST